MNFILRLFLTFSAISFFVIIYMVQNGIQPFKYNTEIFPLCLYILSLFIPFALTFISLFLCKCLAISTLKEIESIEPSNNDFLANYLAYFFVAIGIKEIHVFWVVFSMTILFTFFSRVSYFNPILLIYGYNFYYIKTNQKVKIMLITKKKLKEPTLFEEIKIRRINDYTFIEI